MLRFIVIASVTLFLSSEIRGASLTDCVCANFNSTGDSYVFDDDTLNKLKQQLELLNASNDVLRLRLGMISTRLDQQTEILNAFSLKLSQPVDPGHSFVPPIDVRTGVLSEPESHNVTKYPSTCAEAAALKRRSGLYPILLPTFSSEPFLVSCNEETQGGGWTVIQRRQDGSIDFYRDWISYKIGFGNLEGEFFIGLDKLHAMTTEIPQELLIVMSDFDGVTKYAKYNSFAIGDETEMYALKVLGKYEGDAGDSLKYHVGYKFSTKDKQNDINSTNCAVQFKGAWWYKNCHASNLNGLYLKGTYPKENYAQGVDWNEWRGHYYSLKTVQMLIRPKRG